MGTVTRYLDACGHVQVRGRTCWLPALFVGPCPAGEALSTLGLEDAEIAIEADP